jgi:hypothetical protein
VSFQRKNHHPILRPSPLLFGIGCLTPEASRVDKPESGQGVVLGKTIPHAPELVSYWPDGDGDGYGYMRAEPTKSALGPLGWVPNNLDCNDHDDTVSPGRVENCHTVGKDDDCDGLMEEDGAAGCTPWWSNADDDGDGVGRGEANECSCTPPADAITEGPDCDDDTLFKPKNRCALLLRPDLVVPHPRNDVLVLSDVSAGDLTGDGRADILFTGPTYRQGATVVSWPEGNDTLEPTQVVLPWAEDIKPVGDLTGDGGADVWAHSPSGELWIVEGPLLSTGALPPVWAQWRDAADFYNVSPVFGGEGDVDGNGEADILFTFNPGDPWKTFAAVVENPTAGSHTISEARAILGASEASYGGVTNVAMTGDLDGDGVSEVALGHSPDPYGVFIFAYPSGNVSVDQADASIQPSTSDDYLYTDIEGSVQDADGDGYPELLFRTDFHILVFNGLGSGRWSELDADAKITGEGHSAFTTVAEAGDVEGDGHGDIIAGGYTGDYAQVSVFRVPTVGVTYASQATALYLNRDLRDEHEVLRWHVSAPGDLDGDGTIDLVADHALAWSVFFDPFEL